jgi:flagellar motor switch protein FliN
MGEGSLSQDEIDALLMGADDSPSQDISSVGGGGGSPSTIAPPISPTDKDILTDILKSSFSLGASTLSSVLSKPVRVSDLFLEVKKPNEIVSVLGGNVAFMSAKFLSQALTGKFTLTMGVDSASKIVSVMMGGMSQGMDTAQLKTLRECIEPMISASTAQLQQRLGIIVTNSSIDTNIAKLANDVPIPEGSQLLVARLSLDIEGIPTVKLNYILSLSTAEDIISLSRKVPTAPQNVDYSSQQSGGLHVSVGNTGGGGNMQGQIPNQQQIPIKSVGFPSLSTAAAPQGGGNLNLLMDVQMALTVELGRTKMYIKDILGLGEGSIIELDKLAGEPVDLLVNGKLIAKGEVVVIDENFGVRVTDIVSPTDRLKTESK